MATKNFSYLIEFDEENKCLIIYRIDGDDRCRYTSVELPEVTWDENPDEIRKFCRVLGENILADSPVARKIFAI